MASPLPPSITKVTNANKNDVPDKGVLSGSTITFEGKGFPALSLNIEITSNGAALINPVKNVIVSGLAAWTIELKDLPAGPTVIKFTEDASNPVVAAPPGVISWSFTVELAIKEDFETISPLNMTRNWQFRTPINFYCNCQTLNWTTVQHIRNLLDGTTHGFPGEMEGNVLCFKYIPTIPEDQSLVSFGILTSDTSALSCSKISFWYLCQTNCTAYAYNNSGAVVDQKTLTPGSKKPQQMILSATDIRSVAIIDTSRAISPNIRYSAAIDQIEFTPA